MLEPRAALDSGAGEHQQPARAVEASAPALAASLERGAASGKRVRAEIEGGEVGGQEAADCGAEPQARRVKRLQSETAALASEVTRCGMPRGDEILRALGRRAALLERQAAAQELQGRVLQQLLALLARQDAAAAPTPQPSPPSSSGGNA